MMAGGADARRFEACIRGGGVALFGADTVYGLACAPDDPDAVSRLYELKRRPSGKAAAVMFFSVAAALRALGGSLGPRTLEALGRLLPGGVTVLLDNPARLFPLACAEDPATLGLRVVSIPQLAGVSVPVLQSSANLAGGPDARRLEDVPAELRAAVDLVVDGGELPGVPSTVLDLRRFERGGADTARVLRAGAVGEQAIAAALAGQFHFDPATYDELIHDDIPSYDALQDAVAEAAAAGRVHVGSMLELGTGTGETARRLLARLPGAAFVGVDESAAMLEAATAALAGFGERVALRVARLQDPLPEGPFELVASALCVHHLTGAEKADLFARVRAVLSPGGRFVLGDVVVPDDTAAATTSLTPGYDRPDTVADQLRWLAEAGFEARLVWSQGDLAVIVAATAVGRVEGR